MRLEGNVGLYYPYRQYTNLFIFRFVTLLCLRSTLRLFQFIQELDSLHFVLFLSDKGPMLETLDYTIRIGSTPKSS